MRTPVGIQKDNIIILEFDGQATNTLERLKKANPDKNEHYWANWVDVEITDQKCQTYNTATKMYAENSVYEGKKGLYIKKDGRKHYLIDFK